MSLPKVYTFEYELKDFDTKEELDSSNGEPISFVEGKGAIIKGLESEIVNMSEGESKNVVVKPENAYGVYDDSLLETHPKEQFAGIELKEGMVLFGNTEDGQTVQVSVKSYDGDSVTIDYNHPLAGKTLEFSMTLIGVRDATEQEANSGEVECADSCCGSGCGCH